MQIFLREGVLIASYRNLFKVRKTFLLLLLLLSCTARHIHTRKFMLFIANIFLAMIISRGVPNCTMTTVQNDDVAAAYLDKISIIFSLLSAKSFFSVLVLMQMMCSCSSFFLHPLIIIIIEIYLDDEQTNDYYVIAIINNQAMMQVVPVWWCETQMNVQPGTLLNILQGRCERKKWMNEWKHERTNEQTTWRPLIKNFTEIY